MVQCLRAGKGACPSSRRAKAFTLSLPFGSLHALSGLDCEVPTHTDDGGCLSFLLSQMLTSSRNTLTDPVRNNVLPIL